MHEDGYKSKVAFSLAGQLQLILIYFHSSDLLSCHPVVRYRGRQLVCACGRVCECVCTRVQVRWGAAGALPSIFSHRKWCDVSRGNDMIRAKQGCLSMGHAAQDVGPSLRRTDNWNVTQQIQPTVPGQRGSTPTCILKSVTDGQMNELFSVLNSFWRCLWRHDVLKHCYSNWAASLLQLSHTVKPI